MDGQSVDKYADVVILTNRAVELINAVALQDELALMLK